jgi:hypothetical protein
MMNTLNRQYSPDVDSPAALPVDTPLPQTMAKKYRPTQPIVLGILLVASVGSIVAMRRLAGKAIIESESTQQVDYTHTIDPARSAEYDRIMTDLARLEKPMQLDVDLAAAAAFGEKKQTQLVATGGGEKEGDTLTRERTRQKNDLTSKASALVVQSVMGGRHPVARISGETYGVGDRVNDTFVIKEIEGRSVTLEAKGYLFTLAMETVQQKRMPGGGTGTNPPSNKKTSK